MGASADASACILPGCDGYLMTTTWYQNWIVRHVGQS
jgi:hypothetical protein